MDNVRVKWRVGKFLKKDVVVHRVEGAREVDERV